eukprot:NODE_2350_length_484_cov_118.349425_g1928_i0.p2 GENE.NODE_2350_length_484_cov_118.349425_g1928_i0~~NODE_2350_length_484_cov_118.349425_g1928_i0.p2  ORF type:complete len:51 (+),score=23.42 NODE_2350_length_484_cov_118.349425_g1928_i0:32-154(+)
MGGAQVPTGTHSGEPPSLLLILGTALKDLAKLGMVFVVAL